MRELDIEAIRRECGTVDQNVKLMRGSILENITIGLPSVGLSEVLQACEIAGLTQDIKKMPLGLHTVLHDNGANLSGGQRQRLAIARAVVGHPKLIILDEATSALDRRTEARVQGYINELKCTRVVVAHRLSTIAAADKIYVLEGGAVSEVGTHQQLLEKNGVYASMVRGQNVS